MRSRIFILAILSILFVSATSQSFRLPRNVIPVSYKIQLISVLDEIPQYARFTAPGQVWIRVNCTQATNSITLHQLDLNITEANVQVKNSVGDPLPIASFERQLQNDFFIINLQNGLVAGQNYEIYIPYTAPISGERLDGIYLDSYVDPLTNKTRWVSTTLFAANNARRAFPSFDEPDLKAEFEIVLGRAPDYHALANTHLVATEPMPEIPGWFWDTFATTPKMSTYLVCMIVSDLTYEEAPSDDPDAVTHRVYAPYYFIDRGGGVYSANLSQTVNSAFELYYEIGFPLRKLDNVALPQFYFSAMENWGLMTFADRVLLYFEGETSAAQKYQLSLTVSHEVSHNFFGNIVTCRWWTWVWLNEGWATFVSHQGLQMTYPELRPWDQFVPNVYQNAMATDASLSTHPIANEPSTPEAIGAIYDRIAYDKGASIIRMAESFLSEVVMQNGVRRYLQKWQFGNAAQDDLFAELQAAVEEINPGVLPVGITVKAILDTWTTQAGYPLLTVWRTTPNQIVISQEQFVKNGITTGDERWWIPVEIQRYAGGTPTTSFFWMSSNPQNLTLNIPESDFYFVNPRSIGYYRVLYENKMLSNLVQNYGRLEPLMRAKLLDDSFALAATGEIDMELPFKLTQFLDQEDDFIVWKTAKRNLEKWIIQLEGSDAGHKLKEYTLDKISKTAVSGLTFASQLLSEELEELRREIGFANTVFTEEIISQKIYEYINPSRTDQVVTKTVEGIAKEIGLNKNSLRISIQVLKKQLESFKTPKMTVILTKIFLEVCKYGNSLDDLQLIQTMTLSTLHLQDRSELQKCVNIVNENIQFKNEFASRINSILSKPC